MGLNEQFKTAAEEVLGLSKAPDNSQKLKLYAFFKQASTGDPTGSRPGMFDMVNRAKYDAWADLKGMSRDEAMQKYIDFVESLKGS